MAAVRPPAGMTVERFRARYKAYQELLAASPRAGRASDYQQESLLRSLENAYRLLNSDAAKAFDLSLEPKASYDTYNTGRFGLGCLLARRLVEAGAALHRGDHRVRPVPRLGHARQRPHPRRAT